MVFPGTCAGVVLSCHLPGHFAWDSDQKYWRGMDLSLKGDVQGHRLPMTGCSSWSPRALMVQGPWTLRTVDGRGLFRTVPWSWQLQAGTSRALVPTLVFCMWIQGHGHWVCICSTWTQEPLPWACPGHQWDETPCFFKVSNVNLKSSYHISLLQLPL